MCRTNTEHTEHTKEKEKDYDENKRYTFFSDYIVSVSLFYSFFNSFPDSKAYVCVSDNVDGSKQRELKSDRIKM